MRRSAARTAVSLIERLSLRALGNLRRHEVSLLQVNADRCHSRRHFNWNDLEWIQLFAKTPVILKGILNPDDAEEAVRRGVAAVIVSNHGGRVLDTEPTTIEVLPAVVNQVARRPPVLFDSGIRRGTDILKGLAYGAPAVLIGRPYIYGLSVSGVNGVRDAVNILRAELEGAMAMTGRLRPCDHASGVEARP
jgi:4-hydroxymandelate oxidase